MVNHSCYVSGIEQLEFTYHAFVVADTTVAIFFAMVTYLHVMNTNACSYLNNYCKYFILWAFVVF